MGTALCAAWSLGVLGRDENGGEIEQVDDLRPFSQAQEAGRGGEGELAFIRNAAIFSNLAEDERFRSTYLSELAALREQGSRSRMKALLTAEN